MMSDLYHQLFALSDPVRMTLCILMHEHGATLHVAKLQDMVNDRLDRTLEQSTISHHIAILHNAGLVRRERSGLYTFYHFDRAAYEQALDALQVLLPVRAWIAIA
jgi:ArsR family transcriptional regulator, arsenate/arsenite/antimonite-responsive transcriptional repressor